MSNNNPVDRSPLPVRRRNFRILSRSVLHGSPIRRRVLRGDKNYSCQRQSQRLHHNDIGI